LYVAGQSLGRLLNQSSQVVGFAFGGVLLTVTSPRKALLVDAVTFIVSAAVLFWGVKAHSERATSVLRKPFLADIVDGVRIVFSSRLLSGLVILAWAGTAFAVIPEALAAPYARELDRGATAVGLILAASPVGTVLGVTAISQFVSPQRRLRLVRPLAVLSCVPLIVGLFHPPLELLLFCLVISGAAMAFHIPANQTFMLALAPEARGRGFGLAAGGLALSQGIGLLLGGAVAEWLSPAVTVGIAGAVGTALMPVIATYAGLAGHLESSTKAISARLDHPIG
jgi:MFS family permease